MLEERKSRRGWAGDGWVRREEKVGVSLLSREECCECGGEKRRICEALGDVGKKEISSGELEDL